MDKPTLLIQGSSWTVGAYKKSTTVNCDELIPGGIAELLAEHFTVTNISVQDDFNLGSSWRLKEHLKTNGYDKILICQNDALMDVNVLTTTSKDWAAGFDFVLQELIDNNINTITQYVHYALNKYYSQLPPGTYVFAGPSLVNDALAYNNNLHPIQPDWTSAVIPGFVPSYIYNSTTLDTVTQLLLELFPSNATAIKQEFIQYWEDATRVTQAWQDNLDLFAYAHPSPLANKIYYKQLLQHLLN